MSNVQPPSEEELIAYLDGELSAARRAEIALYIAQHADVAQRMAEYQAIDAGLIAVHGDEIIREQESQVATDAVAPPLRAHWANVPL